MPNSKKSKIKLVKLYEILKSQTDVNHPLTTYDLIDRLTALDISCDRRTISKDVSELNAVGFNVHTKKVGKQKAYYIDDTTLTVSELKILIDAVQAASFIPEDMSNEIIEKISALGGTHREEVLKGNQVAFNTRKHSNTDILRTIDVINKAISEHKKISFRYFDLDENKERVFRKNKRRYLESPAALVFNNDNYYVVCYSSKHKKQLNYRVDRMNLIRVEEESAAPEAEILADNLTEYTKQAFRMFSGEPEEITLQFDRSVLGHIYDQFGEETEVKALSDDLLEATVQVQISPTFRGWLAQFEEKISVVDPDK
ncbi:MAG: WYL domain-containing protein [Oscillospiraceae bacterium]|nr:WYL domain-containing protein [Oscillospiraceae bacterium]